jgi:hypothetical protein
MACLPCYKTTSETREEVRKREEQHFMEEQQIQDFVHCVSHDETLRKELASNPDGVIMREGFSPRVARILARLVPQLTLDKALEPTLNFWR